MHLDLDGILSGLVDAQLLLCFMRILRKLQLIQQVHTSAIIKQQIDSCTAYGAPRPIAVTLSLLITPLQWEFYRGDFVYNQEHWLWAFLHVDRLLEHTLYQMVRTLKMSVFLRAMLLPSPTRRAGWMSPAAGCLSSLGPSPSSTSSICTSTITVIVPTVYVTCVL